MMYLLFILDLVYGEEWKGHFEKLDMVKSQKCSFFAVLTYPTRSLGSTGFNKYF